MFDARVLSGLDALIAVIETGSFIRAAGALGLSDSGVSRAVSRLEARLGVRLIERSTRSMRLTEAGARFYAEAAPLLAALSNTAAGLAGTVGKVQGRLRVEMDPFFSRLVFAPRVDLFLSRFPDLQLDIITTELAGDLVAHGFDCAIRFGEPANTGLIARKLLDTRILTVAAPQYLEQHGRPASPVDLVAHRCINYRDPGTGRPFAWEFARLGEVLPVPVEGALTVSDVGTLIAACVSGVGVAQVMALGTRAMIESGSLVELFPDWPDEMFPLYAFHPSRHQPPPKVRALVEFCVTIAQEGVGRLRSSEAT